MKQQIRIGDIVELRQVENDQTAYLVIDVLDDEKVAIQEVSSRILKVERVVDAGRLKVLF